MRNKRGRHCRYCVYDRENNDKMFIDSETLKKSDKGYTTNLNISDQERQIIRVSDRNPSEK